MLNRAKTHEQYVKELEQTHGGKIKILNIYTTKRNKGTYKCLTCNHEWSSQAGNLVRNKKPSGCPKCAKSKLQQRITEYNALKFKSTKEKVPLKIKEIYGDIYELLSEYEHHRKKLVLRCRHHGIFKQRFDSLLDGHGCPKCGLELREKKIKEINNKTLIMRTQTFNEKFLSVSNREYEVVSEYKSTNEYIKVKHLDCGHIWNVTPANFIWNNRRCPKCNFSKPVNIIENFLKNFQIPYVFEKRIDVCRDIRPLPFDLFLNKEVLIEYDGEQHFKAIDFSGKGKEWSESQLVQNKHHDKIKNQYCIDNSIPLIRIPYWEFNNIEYILENVLQHFKLIESDNTYDKEIVLKYLVDENWNQDTYIEMSKTQ